MMVMQPDIFGGDERPAPPGYPDTPGWKAQSTSRAAAMAMTTCAKTYRELVLAEIRRAPGTCEQIALRLRTDLLTIRPRCSELKNLGKIKPSGRCGDSRSGKRAIIWETI